MEIHFANNHIRRICSSLQQMRMKLGDVRAKKLTMRLDQLEAVSCLDRLRNVAGDWHELTQNRKGQIAAGIGQPYRIIVMPTQDPPPTKPDDGLD